MRGSTITAFLITPYRKVHNRKLSEEIEWLRADEESIKTIAPADTPTDKTATRSTTIA